MAERLIRTDRAASTTNPPMRYTAEDGPLSASGGPFHGKSAVQPFRVVRLTLSVRSSISLGGSVSGPWGSRTTACRWRTLGWHEMLGSLFSLLDRWISFRRDPALEVNVTHVTHSSVTLRTYVKGTGIRSTPIRNAFLLMGRKGRSPHDIIANATMGRHFSSLGDLLAEPIEDEIWLGGVGLVHPVPHYYRCNTRVGRESIWTDVVISVDRFRDMGPFVAYFFLVKKNGRYRCASTEFSIS